jgi:hypothetical protein
VFFGFILAKKQKRGKMAEPPLFPQAPPVETHQKKVAKDAEVHGKLTKSITNLEMRLKILEDRYANLRKKTQLTDQNMIESEKDIWEEVRNVNDDLIELKKKVNEIIHHISQMNEELKTTAKKYDLRVIENYLDLWQPMNFVTKEELEKE